jgi:hypothetical protein
MTYWTWLWLGWLAYFAVVEGLAILLGKDRGATFSEHVWAFIGRGQVLDQHVKLRRILFLSFSAWLVTHLFTGWV